MKKIVAIILTSLMLLSSAACGGKADVAKFGVLHGDGMDLIMTSEHKAHMFKETELTGENINYSNLSTALMDLESGKLESVCVEKCVADYVVARNEKTTVVEDWNCVKTDFSMMTLDSKNDVYDILNNAIKAMKEDGTLDSLIQNELKAYINSDPVAKDLPKFEGAQTIKVGVTGDMPPMDFVASNGKAAGFNIALLTEIANRAQVNIELVQIESGARAIALSSGNVDAVFWTKNTTCTVCNSTAAENVNGTLVTESYYSDYSATVTLKSEK